MRTKSLDFPAASSVWHGSILASIAHAIFVARAPFLAHEQSWDGRNYNVQDSEGSRGTIAFGDDERSFVAAFFLESSDRNPLRRGAAGVGTPKISQDIPEELETLYERALQYLLQDLAGTAVPVVTAAFWSDINGALVLAAEPWLDVVEHGARLVQIQMLPLEAALARWAAEFEFSSAETALVDALFKRRIAVKGQDVRLTPAEAQQMRDMAQDDGGLQACRESLGEIGITWP
jgi:hypothetical protein